MTDSEFTREMRSLEEEMWAHNPERLSELLAAEFTDFCRFGNVYDREDIINTTVPDGVEVSPMEDFAVDRLAPTVALLTYVNSVTTNGTTERARRSSIWVNDDEAWQLRFVQATTLPV